MRATNSLIQGAYSIAAKFLARMKILNPPTGTSTIWSSLSLAPQKSSSSIAEFLWHDETPIIEFPFVQDPYQIPSGSVLISTERSLPPIISYTVEGPSYAQQILQHIALPMALSGRVLGSYEICLASPLEPVLKIRHKGKNKHEYLVIPGLQSHFLDGPFPTRSNSKTAAQGSFDNEWNFLEAPVETWLERMPLDTPRPYYVANFCQPTKYNQACESTAGLTCRIATGGGTNYCSPKRIAGCTPVGWALMASALKRGGTSSEKNLIWPNSTCWNLDWMSYLGVPDPTRCAEVGKTIWELHQALGTDDSGSTSSDNVQKGGDYLSSTFHLGTRWGQTANPTVVNYQSVIGGHFRPAIFSAAGQWSPTPGPPDGHTVVAYGYDRPNNSIYISMGWGSGWPDRWINLGSYQDTYMISSGTL